MDGRKDAGEQLPTDGNLGELERDGVGVADYSCPNLDQPGLQAGLDMCRVDLACRQHVLWPLCHAFYSHVLIVDEPNGECRLLFAEALAIRAAVNILTTVLSGRPDGLRCTR